MIFINWASDASVTNVKCKLLCVRFYISILIFSNLYVEMVTVRFHSLPHCETNDRSQLQLSAYLSVPRSFEALTPNSDAISFVSTVNYVYVLFCSNINPHILLSRDALEGIAARRSLRICKTLRTIVIIQSYIITI